MLTFLVAVTVNSFLFMSFLGISMAHANGDDALADTDIDLNNTPYVEVIATPMPKDPMTAILSAYKPQPDQNIEPQETTSALRRRPCGDRGFDVLIIEQSKLDGSPVLLTDFADDDCLQIHYQRRVNAFNETRVPKLSIVNFADDTGAYIRLDGETVAEISGAQFMSPDNINLVAV